MFRFFSAMCLGALAAGSALAACATDAQISAFVEDYMANTPTAALAADGTMEDALCTQAKVAEALSAKMGPVIGYKAGLTSRPAQERFGVEEPVHGVLYRDMMLEDGASVPVQFGAIPMFEADLVLVVGSEAINQAQNSREVMTHLSAIHPFIELPDLTYAQGEPINAVTLTAIGVAPKLGVLGPALDVPDHDALSEMNVTVTAADGTLLAEAPGAAVLGHPANSVLWLVSKGIELKPGDLVSVGSIGPLIPPAKAKGGATVRYLGLPGDPEVSVVFEE
ncbi:2-keto-4-pentenoate hydratase [Thalassococcus sp. S3]|uniref:2-keto-4-pentenoate hydratase n=1 Tax=Thalassococcus sp. S3 TaxID=2017482 RepID=UPI001024139F|nr:fumarylacetoacetate hydrolase family protein [Thalassococcus sp. S3]QBF29825.1 hydratase [Thalassococcus sp. S3]